ncbi:hypothetical protein B0H14DRAFT_3449770 [Mycena olivaceomarginata]|nr:hypothetical protein B0H14DRAFT_3449770 [Mycena olivaceomarginata]
MSTTSQSIEEIIPFIFFNAPNDFVVGTDALLDGTGNIDYNLPTYRLTDADVVPTPGRPLLTVSPSERGPSRVQAEGNLWPLFHFLSHPAIYRLMPFIRVPARIPRTDPTDLATILDRAVPVFENIQHSYVFIPHSRAQLVVLVGLLRLVSAVSQIVPARVQSGWTAFLPANEPATSPTWDTYPPLSTVWLLPGTEEFPMEQPLRDPLSVADHSTLLRIAPNLRVLVHFMARNRIRGANGPRMAVSLLNKALAPTYPISELLIDEFREGHLSPSITHIIFNSTVSSQSPRIMQANRTLTPALVIPRLPHEDLSSEPYPVMSDYDSMWYWWRRLQDKHPSAVAVRDARADSTSPHHWLTTPPASSTPMSPFTPTGPSAVGSASFDICSLRPSSVRGSPSKPEAITDTRSTPTPEMQVDLQEISPEDARAITEVLAADEPALVLSPPCPLLRARQKNYPGESASAPSSSVANVDPKGWPMIHVQSSRKSFTPPAEEVYNEEREEEREDDEDEKVTLLRKHKRTESRAPKGKGKAKSGTPAPSSRFPSIVHKTRGKSKKDELPAYILPRPVPTMDTVRLAADSMRDVPIAYSANRECEHGTPGTLCDHCKKGHLSHCTHTFTVPEHVQAANHIEPYAHLSNQCGNALLFDLSAARVDYELACLDGDGGGRWPRADEQGKGTSCLESGRARGRAHAEWHGWLWEGGCKWAGMGTQGDVVRAPAPAQAEWAVRAGYRKRAGPVLEADTAEGRGAEWRGGGCRVFNVGGTGYSKWRGWARGVTSLGGGAGGMGGVGY